MHRRHGLAPVRLAPVRLAPVRLALVLLALVPAARVAAAPPPAPGPAPTPAIVTPAGFRGAIEAQRGRVLLVNLWASWCAPCRREIPELVRLGREFGRCGLEVLGLTLDEPATLATIVAPLVARDFPGFRTLAGDGSSPDSFASVLDGAWNEVLPTSYVVAPDGRVVQRLQGGKPYADFAAAVRPHLACPAS